MDRFLHGLMLTQLLVPHVYFWKSAKWGSFQLEPKCAPVTRLGRSLGIATTVEGVETGAQLELRREGWI